MSDEESLPHPDADGLLTGPVKWYDAAKGFGFVMLGQGGADAFLHVKTLRRHGYDHVSQGDRLTCRVSTGDRGAQVTEILSVETVGSQAGEQIVGRVKFYDLSRGYGFVVDEQGREIFVGSKLLKRLGLAPLRTNQAVRVSAVPGASGLVAETLTFI
jgi:CspA family cold shock protein